MAEKLSEELIVSKTPYRISFFGGGTDHPAWFLENEGAVISSAINKYCYLTCRELPSFYTYKHRLVYSSEETVNELTEIVHQGFRGVMTALNVNEPLEIHHDGDLPARSGVGSSSSFTVGLLNAISFLRGKVLSNLELAKMAIDIEQNINNEIVGLQDQIAASFGGLNRINFKKDGGFDVLPLAVEPITRQVLESHMLLLFTGTQRRSSDIEQTKLQRLNESRVLLSEMHGLVDDATLLLTAKKFDIATFGKLLDESWFLKRQLSNSVSTKLVDEIYSAAKRNGALGGKLLGAGGGGFMLLIAPPSTHADIMRAMTGLVFTKVGLNGDGSKIIAL